MELQSGTEVTLRELTFRERPKVLFSLPEGADWREAPYFTEIVEKCYTATELAVTHINGERVTNDLLNSLTHDEAIAIGMEVIGSVKMSSKKK